MHTMNSFKILPCISLFILCYNLLPAAILPFNARIHTANPTNPVTIGLPTATAIVQVTPSWTGPFVDVAVKNKITLGIDHQNMTFITLAGDIKVRIKLEEWAVSNTTTTPSSTTYPDLTINYQPFSNTVPYIDKSVFTFNGAYKFRITIDAITQNGIPITTLPANVFIDADIMVERYGDFSINSTLTIASPVSASKTLDLNCDGIFDELVLFWTPMAGAEEYHLEWTFVNDYDLPLGLSYLPPGGLKYDFKNNSTRITTRDTSYNITLTFEHGYLLYRVRGIGRDLSNPSQDIVGIWNELDHGNAGAVANRYYNTQEHEANKNWQYSATFAEEGKKKEVISYFDGGLRNRQSVTKVNSDKNTIVGETIYDHQGRPAVNVLPVPVPATDPNCPINESPLKFYPNFNRNESTTVVSYDRDSFDLDASPADPCDMKVSPMSILSGASNYYSPANPKKSGWQAFVPDGEKYPFTQIEYTPDNTGRIRRQGGVGPKYQLGTNHETKYFYGWPNQTQLDRLFGSEVGDAAHYKKNLVIDANGQVSVSYLDQEGRTIATALAGDAPKAADNATTILAPLDSESSAVKQLTIDLFAKNALGESSINTKNIPGNAIVFNSQLLVAYESEYKFDYVLNIDQFTDLCLDTAGVCFSCVYDLEIRVTDDCGQTVTPMPGTGAHLVNKTIGHFTADANGNVVSFNRDCTGATPFTQNEFFTLNLPVGNYTVSKILTINSAARDFYVATYLDSTYNSCVKTLSDFQQEAFAKIDTSGCNITCESCIASLQYINGKQYLNASEARDAYVAAGIGTELEFDYLLEECGAPCKTISWCEATYQQMLLDVSPDGQYAQFQNTVGGQAPDLALSVLYENNILPKSFDSGGPVNWKKPKININGSNYSQYLDANGTPSVIHVSPDGANFIPVVDNPALVQLDPVGNFHYTVPQNLEFVKDFVNNWKDNWAKSLVQYHPEYCYYESCASYSKNPAGYSSSSDDFDSLLLVTNTYQQAADTGLILNSYPGLPPIQAASDINAMAQLFYTTAPGDPKDPFFFTYGLPAVANFQALNGVPYSMVKVAAITARCGTTYQNGPIPLACEAFGKEVGADPIENKRILVFSGLMIFVLPAPMKWIIKCIYRPGNARWLLTCST
ncbi:MAG: hypothetical protein IPN33_22150 [Saprospiraceae bacterium]|nr:hypothetical protein [Saprospiraceae bacterium]